MSLRNQVDKLLRKFEREFAVHNRIEVSRAAILHNVELFAKLSGQLVIPVLKGNAYGHGIEQVAEALKGTRLPYIAVDGYFEALRVREVSDRPVLVMGAIKPENFKRMKYDNFAFVVQDAETVQALAATGKPLKVHLECNTGMNRYGVKSHEVEDLTKLILSHKNLELEGVMSHLADSDGTDPATVEMAVEQFDSSVRLIRTLGADPKILHIAQTAGSVVARSKYANAVRVGIGLYGINPFSHRHKLNPALKDLKPALRLISTITKVTELEKGDKVSYNYMFTAPKKMKIGVLPLGYFEGVNRALSNKGVVQVGNTFVPIVGKVCMNHTMINLDGIGAKVGDEVIIYGNNPKDKNAIDAIAKDYDLFNYVLLTSLSHDVRRTLIP
jgi:alanine racemase